MDGKQDLEGKARKKLKMVMSSLDRLISQIEDLDQLLNEYRGLGVDASVRQFYQGSEFTRPLHHLQDLQAWRREVTIL